MKQIHCAKRGCEKDPTQAFDVFSWFEEQRKQTPTHYEVCDDHASYFTEIFNREKSEAVKRDLNEWGVAL